MSRDQAITFLLQGILAIAFCQFVNCDRIVLWRIELWRVLRSELFGLVDLPTIVLVHCWHCVGGR